MSPRARRSESITSPPASHPGLIRYNDDKTFTSEKPSDCDDDVDGYDDNDSVRSESVLDSASDGSYDLNDSNDSCSSSISSLGTQKSKDASAA
jgi:hypothetical protein